MAIKNYEIKLKDGRVFNFDTFKMTPGIVCLRKLVGLTGHSILELVAALDFADGFEASIQGLDNEESIKLITLIADSLLSNMDSTDIEDIINSLVKTLHKGSAQIDPEEEFSADLPSLLEAIVYLLKGNFTTLLEQGAINGAHLEDQV